MQDVTITFKCDQAFFDWLGRECMAMDKSKSELIRACILLGLPQIKSIRGLDRVCFEDIRETRTGNNT